MICHGLPLTEKLYFHLPYRHCQAVIQRPGTSSMNSFYWKRSPLSWRWAISNLQMTLMNSWKLLDTSKYPCIIHLTVFVLHIESGRTSLWDASLLVHNSVTVLTFHMFSPRVREWHDSCDRKVNWLGQVLACIFIDVLFDVIKDYKRESS